MRALMNLSMFIELGKYHFYTEPEQKSWGGGGEGSKETFGGRGVKKFHEILQQICENLEGWSKFFQNMLFFCQIFTFLTQNFF